MLLLPAQVPFPPAPVHQPRERAQDGGEDEGGDLDAVGGVAFAGETVGHLLDLNGEIQLNNMFISHVNTVCISASCVASSIFKKMHWEVLMSAGAVERMGRLVSDHRGVSSLEEAREWRARADELLADWPQILSSLTADVDAASRAVDAQLADDAARPWWRRMRRSDRAMGAAQLLDQARDALRDGDVVRRDLAELLDVLPTTDEARRQLLAALSLRKKELNIEKRALAGEIRGVRGDARQRSIDADSGLVARLAGKELVAERRKIIAADRDKGLRPLEVAKQAIDSQLLDIERASLKLQSL